MKCTNITFLTALKIAAWFSRGKLPTTGEIADLMCGISLESRTLRLYAVLNGREWRDEELNKIGALTSLTRTTLQSLNTENVKREILNKIIKNGEKLHTDRLQEP